MHDFGNALLLIVGGILVVGVAIGVIVALLV